MLFDEPVLDVVRSDPEGQLERPSAQLLKHYLHGAEALRCVKPVGEDEPTPHFYAWVCQRYFGKDIISYWNWDGIATLLAQGGPASFQLALRWMDLYRAEHPVAAESVACEVSDKLVEYLGTARVRPALIFGNTGSPWVIQAFLNGYRQACVVAAQEPAPAYRALMDYGKELAEEIALTDAQDLSWARAVGFTRAGFGGDRSLDWLPKLLEVVEDRFGVAIPPVPKDG